MPAMRIGIFRSVPAFPPVKPEGKRIWGGKEP